MRTNKISMQLIVLVGLLWVQILPLIPFSAFGSSIQICTIFGVQTLSVDEGGQPLRGGELDTEGDVCPLCQVRELSGALLPWMETRLTISILSEEIFYQDFFSRLNRANLIVFQARGPPAFFL